jgi:hypothetical protein
MPTFLHMHPNIIAAGLVLGASVVFAGTVFFGQLGGEASPSGNPSNLLPPEAKTTVYNMQKGGFYGKVIAVNGNTIVMRAENPQTGETADVSAVIEELAGIYTKKPKTSQDTSPLYEEFTQLTLADVRVGDTMFAPAEVSSGTTIYPPSVLIER